MQHERRPLAATVTRYAPETVTLLSAAGFTVTDAALQAAGEHDTPYGLLPVALIAAQGVVLLLLRRRRPLLALAGCVGLNVLLLVVTRGDIGGGALAVVFAVYAVAVSRRRLSSVAALGAGAAVTFVVSLTALLQNPEYGVGLSWTASGLRLLLEYAVPAGIAEVVVSRRRVMAVYRERAERAERDREVEIARALREERTAMARDLHDIAAHRLTGIIVNAQAAAALLPDRGEQALEHVRVVRTDARHALDDLRATVSLLRGTDGGGGHRPGEAATVPLDATGVADLDALVEQARARGERVGFTVTGAPVALGPLAETAVFRMVQESLTNVARHAPGAAADVSLHYAPDAVTVTVSNDAPPSRVGAPAGTSDAPEQSTGLGLIGMAERATLVGGRLETAPTPDGGWRNRLHLPEARS